MAMKRQAYLCFAVVPMALSFPPAAHAQVPETDRHEIDQIVGAKGTYISEEGVYKIVLPREAATLVLDYQTLVLGSSCPPIGLERSLEAFIRKCIHRLINSETR